MQQQKPYPTSYPQSNEFPPSQTEMEPMPASPMDADNKSGWCLLDKNKDSAVVLKSMNLINAFLVTFFLVKIYAPILI